MLQIKAEVVNITPTDAAKWLSQKVNNRNITGANVDRMVDSLQRGEWTLNGEAIKFNQQGKLIDGQHRLAAIVKSGIPMRSLVVRELGDDAFDSLDQGQIRTSGDVLTAHGVKNGNLHAAIAAWIVRYESKAITNGISFRGVARAHILAAEKAHPEIEDSLPHGRRVKHLLSPSLAGYCHWRMNRIDPDLAQEFFDGLQSGSDLGARHPILILRDRLLQAREPRKKLLPMDILALVTRAWNLWVRGRHCVTHLKLHRPGEPVPEFIVPDEKD